MDKKYTRASERTGPPCPRARQSTKLGDMLMSEKPSLSYADFHHQITGTDDKTFPKSSVKAQKGQGVSRKQTSEEELVRYMSNLPSYLENGGKAVHEKTFNVGVLDWGRLEKWKYTNHKQVPHKDNGYSFSSSSTSYFSTDGSSTHSSRGQSRSPARRRIPRSSLQCPVEVSPSKSNYPDVKSFFSRGQRSSPACQRNQRCIGPESQYPKPCTGERHPRQVNLFGANNEKLRQPSAASNRQQQSLGPDPHLRITEAEINLDRRLRKDSVSCSSSEIRLDRCQRKDSLSCSSSEMGKDKKFSDPSELHRESSLKTRNSHTTVEAVSPQEPSNKVPVQGKKTVVVLLPKGSSQNSGSKVNTDVKQTESEMRSVSDSCDGVYGSSSSSDIPYSCPLPSSDNLVKESCTTTSSAAAFNAQSQPSCQFPHSARISYSPSSSKIMDEKKPTMLLKSTSIAKASADWDVRRNSESTTRGRSASPIKRLSQGLGKIIRNVGSRDNSPLRRSCSRDGPPKFGPDRAAAADSGSDTSCSDKSLANGRARSSPLRRLLDPLFKPKAPSNHQMADAFRRDSTSSAGPDEQLHLYNSPSMKVKPRIPSGKTTSSGYSRQKNKSPSSSQALLQVAVKNDLPLFTFAVDNNSDILAATLRKSSAAEKNHHTWTYTFFTVREIKKKNGLWLHKEARATHPGYFPNVVAQMKVSDRQYTNLTGGNWSKDHECMREFTLFAVDVGQQVDQHAAEFHPTNELAAIIVKPRVNPPTDGVATYARESLPEDGNKSSVNDSVMNTTVILPGGVHTVPSKGAVSTLAQRWKSGGSCDCGGWDLGCQLRVYTNRNDADKKSSSSETPNAFGAEFKLFCQAVEDNQPSILRLTPFKERIHSVEFSSSLSMLQAFAICVSAVDCKRPSAILESQPTITPSGVMISEEDAVVYSKVPYQINQVETPARYVSCPPPHSPVGRV